MARIPSSESYFYNLTLSHTQLKVIAAALNEIPYKLAAPVLDNLEAQVAAIDQARVQERSEAESSHGEKN